MASAVCGEYTCNGGWGWKIGIIGRLNCPDEQLLRTCDSYFIRNHGNIRIPNMDVEKIYDICGYGGGNPHLTLPTSLFFLDGI